MRAEEIVEFTEALGRIAASGGGPKALAAYLAETAGGSVLLEDAKWRHLATAGGGVIPPTARGIVESGRPGRVARIAAPNAELGWLSLFGERRQGDGELLLRLTAAAIGVELARNGAMPRERTADFWDALLARAFHDAAVARDEAAARGIALASHYLAIVFEVDASDASGSDAALADVRALTLDAFRGAQGDIGLVERGMLLFALIPAPRAIDASNAKTAATLLPKSAARRKTTLRISGGVGIVETPAALSASAATAEAALAIGKRIYGNGRVVAYDELGAYRLLYEGADVDRLRRFAADTLAPLRAYDAKHQTELERTLKLYFELGENVKTAAAELNVHRHTVFYRLRQIGEICSRSLEAPADQLSLRLAIAIDELHDSI